MKKKLAFILAFVILSVSIFAVPVMANTGHWVSSGGYWYYYDDVYGYVCDGGYTVNGKLYYFDANGRMLTGWQYLVNQGNEYAWYYFGTDGAMRTGWQKIGGKWYYMNSYGKMMTGWQSIGGKWYYMTSGGAMVTGWYKINGYWYYFSSSGAQQIEWQKIGGAWYYLGKNANESMYYGGIAMIGSKKYCFANNGKMLTGWQKCETTTGSIEWFYFDSSGAMHIGWLNDGGKWYYLNESMYRSGYSYINGKRYVFADNGVCTNPY